MTCSGPAAIDGTHNAVREIVNGATTTPSSSPTRASASPAFQALADFESGKAVAASIVIDDNQYDENIAAAEVGQSCRPHNGTPA